MKQISTRCALLLSLIVCIMLYSPMIEAQQKMYWTNISTGKIQRADLNGSNIEDLVTGLRNPVGIALVLLCQLGCPRTDRPLDWHEKVSCHAVCLPLANVEHGVADPRYK